MNSTTYYKPRISSGAQRWSKPSKPAFDVSDDRHPVQQEIDKCLGQYSLTATFTKDNDTLQRFKHVPGIIAFNCELRKGSEVIGYGHGTSVISKMSRYVEKSVHMALNSSLIEAVVKATKILDVLVPSANPQSAGVSVPVSAIYDTKEVQGFEPATDKQKGYLMELISGLPMEEQNRWQGQLASFSKSDASEAIQSLKR